MGCGAKRGRMRESSEASKEYQKKDKNISIKIWWKVKKGCTFAIPLKEAGYYFEEMLIKFLKNNLKKILEKFCKF